MDSGLGWIALIGGLLLAAAMLFAYFRNRQTTPRERARTEQATHDLYHDLAREEHRQEEQDRTGR